MRDYLLLYLNGTRHPVRGKDAFQSLSDFLRYTHSLTGTKIVCSEGDCGACTVLIGRPDASGKLNYQIVNSCIQFMWQLDCTHILTIEGLRTSSQLTALQDRMVSCHASQCGFCTPGFVMSLTALCQPDRKPLTPTDIKEGLTGNLCRCTGYLPILESALTTDRSQMTPLQDLYPSKEIAADLQSHRAEAVLIQEADRTLHKPADIQQAISFLQSHPATTIFAGGTDLGVRINKGMIAPTTLLSLADLPNSSDISLDGNNLSVGPNTTWSAVESFVKTRIPELHRILVLFGSPQIRNAGTIAGNIANASPIADSLPFLYVTESQLQLTGPNGTRTVPIDQFYKGYKKLDLQPAELITRITIPLPTPSHTLKLYKISKRRHLDISTFTAAVWMKLSGSTIEQIRIAYGGVAPTILRLPKTESFLTGKPFTEATLKQAGLIATTEISPISDVRASNTYRCLLARNILLKLLQDHERLTINN